MQRVKLWFINISEILLRRWCVMWRLYSITMMIFLPTSATHDDKTLVWKLSQNIAKVTYQNCQYLLDFLMKIYEPWLEISYNVVCVTSKGSEQPVHTRSLFRAIASRLNTLWLLSYWPNIIWSFMRRLICYGYSLKVFCQDASNEYPQYIFL